ncbi:MAG: beta-N-acetylhexosaminidase [Verrucomicrobiota bacterium]
MTPLLFPSPSHLSLSGPAQAWPEELSFGPLPPTFAAAEGALRWLVRDAEEAVRRPWRAVAGGRAAFLRFAVQPDLPSEAYQLVHDKEGLALRASTAAGLRHGLHTLGQLFAQCPEEAPALVIEDAPVLEVRGYMLDLSRDKVPTMATLRTLVRTLAGLKFNQLQLYTEHTFAFPGHERVWGAASPLSADEVRELDDWCALWGIELVPCLNTFGHFERWLRHPEYFHLAECPYGWRRPDGYGMPWGSTLHPGPEALAFLKELFAAYLPLFRSDKVNIGGDEPWELGMGRSRERCTREGRLPVYVDFLREVIGAAQAHKREVLFWSDILLEEPSLWEPMDGTTVLVWGYEADHPLADQARALRAQGLPTILCPGTSSWLSLGGRLANALSNIEVAADAAEETGCAGLLLTDWGDHGHHQPPLLSLPALFACAQRAWRPEAAMPDLPTALASCAFGEPSPVLGDLLLELGQLAASFACRPPNRFPLIQVLTTPEAQLAEVVAPLALDELEQARDRLAALQTRARHVELRAPDADLLVRELHLVLALHQWAVDRALAHHRPDEQTQAALPARLTGLIGEFEALWIARHRVGGLHDSAGRLRRVLAGLPTVPPHRPAWPPEIR